MTAPVAHVSAPPTPHFEPDRERGVETAEINDLDFWDLLDVINPLQHIPVISTIYRALTGDTIKPAMNVLGGALYGGPVGLVAAFASNIVEQNTGREPLNELVALVRGEDAAPPSPHLAARPSAASEPPLSLLPPSPPVARAVAGVSAPAGPPPWLGVALEEAKSPRTPAQPPSWIMDAIAGGLDKYAALAKERAGAGEN